MPQSQQRNSLLRMRARSSASSSNVIFCSSMSLLSTRAVQAGDEPTFAGKRYRCWGFTLET